MQVRPDTLLQDRSLPKVGIGISNDGLKLRRDFGLRCDGLLDLATLAAAVLPHGSRPWSLADLSERVLQRAMPKEQRLRVSDWEGRLDAEQLRYAALDVRKEIPEPQASAPCRRLRQRCSDAKTKGLSV